MRVLGAAGLVPLAALTVAQADAATSPQPLGQHAATWTFHHENVLGTSLQVTVRAADRASAIKAETAALAVFDRQATILSAWQPQSEFSRWEKTRFEPVAVSPELFATLAAFDLWRERTDGALDPSVEAATRLWKQSTAAGRVPTNAEIAETPRGHRADPLVARQDARYCHPVERYAARAGFVRQEPHHLAGRECRSGRGCERGHAQRRWGCRRARSHHTDGRHL